jgi:hypothetical protein
MNVVYLYIPLDPIKHPVNSYLRIKSRTTGVEALCKIAAYNNDKTQVSIEFFGKVFSKIDWIPVSQVLVKRFKTQTKRSNKCLIEKV